MTSILKGSSFAVLLLLWFLLSAFFPPTVVPNPVDVGKTVIADLGTGEPFFHIGKTLFRS